MKKKSHKKGKSKKNHCLTSFKYHVYLLFLNDRLFINSIKLKNKTYFIQDFKFTLNKVIQQYTQYRFIRNDGKFPLVKVYYLKLLVS